MHILDLQMLLCSSFILLGVHQLLSIHQFLNGELSWCEFDSMTACQKGKILQGHDCGTSSDAFSIKFKEESHSHSSLTFGLLHVDQMVSHNLYSCSISF